MEVLKTVLVMVAILQIVFSKSIPRAGSNQNTVHDIQSELTIAQNTVHDIQSELAMIDENVKEQSDPETESSFQKIEEINEAAHEKVYEGDIKFETGDPRLNRSNDDDLFKRNARRQRQYLWRNKIVAYVITDQLKSGESTIKAAMQEISKSTCIKFKEKTTETKWVQFVSKGGCWSSVGKSFWLLGAQELSLGDNCLHKGIIIHELLHALGFWHEQSRPDRDKYVEIFWENIQPANVYNFNKMDSRSIDVQEVEYDYDSIMHYGSGSFAKSSGLKTIVPIGDKNRPIGNRAGLSPKDIIEINLLYDCKSQSGTYWSSWSAFGPCNEAENCKKARQRFCSHSDREHCPGADMYGVDTESVQCTNAECYAPVDGHWGKWSSWSSCSVTCDTGIKRRSRDCNDPSPRNGGRECVGSKKSSGVCENKSCALDPADCQFEIDTCIWASSEKHSFKWQRNKGRTSSSGTGPSHDHSKNDVTGYYLYTEASSPAAAGDHATLSSQRFVPTKGTCMSFWYHMFGAGIGSLQISLVELDKVGMPQKQLWSSSGDQGDSWKHGEVDLISDSPYKVKITATRGSSFQSDIAIDDVYFKDEKCSDLKTTAATKSSKATTTTKTITTTTTTTTTKATTSTKATTLAPVITTTPEVLSGAVRIGCFKDNGGAFRSFPDHINMRKYINWYKIIDVVKRCRDHVRSLNFKYFGIQFYGECWYGPSNKVFYDKDGKSTECWKGLVGRGSAFLVYKFKD